MPFEQCRPEDLEFQPDYGVLATRLTRLATEPYEGGAWVVVAPGTTMTEHVNPDHETEIFFVVEGAGVMRVGAETYQVGPGASVLVPPDQPHSLTNDSDRPLRTLALWWGAERNEDAT